jgi:hypothetical protein
MVVFPAPGGRQNMSPLRARPSAGEHTIAFSSVAELLLKNS